MFYLIQIFWFSFVKNYSALDFALQKYLFQLGGVYIKIAQMLSLQTELFDKEIHMILKKRRRIKKHNADINYKQIKPYLSKVKNCKYSHSTWNTYVFKGTYKDKDVLLKILRPHVEESLKSAYDWISFIFVWTEFFSPWINLKNQFHNILILMFKGTDLRNEKQSIEKYYSKMPKKNVHKPKVYQAHKDYIIFEYPKCTDLKENQDKVKRAFIMIWNGYFSHGVAVADFIPENIQVTQEGKIFFTDLTLMYQHEKKKAENVCIFFTFFSLKLNYFASKILFDKLFNNEEFNQEAFDEVRQIIKEEAVYKTDFDVTNCIIRIAKAAHKHQFTLKEEFVNSWIFLMNFQLAIKEIDPEMLFLPWSIYANARTKITPKSFYYAVTGRA